MKPWFTIDHIDANTHIISEYRHWEETHCYLLVGSKRALLIDTSLGICNISEEVSKLTDKPVTAVATHIHWDHIGGHKYYPDFYAHEEELNWLSGEFPLSMETIREMVVDRCDLPEGYDVNTYEFFQGTPTRVLRDGDIIDLGAESSRYFTHPDIRPAICASGRRNAAIFYRRSCLQGHPLCVLPLHRPAGVPCISGKNSRAAGKARVPGPPHAGHSAGNSSPDAQRFSGAERRRSAASRQRHLRLR